MMAVETRPFGKPDAAKKKDGELEDTIDVGQLMPRFHISDDPTSSSLIIGRKGSGKTHALRLIQLASRKRGNWAPLKFCDVDFAAEKAVLSLASDESGRSANAWERIWRCAVALAALSRFTCSEPDTAAATALQVSSLTQDEVRSRWARYHFPSQKTLGPLSVLSRILEINRNGEDLLSYCFSADLEEVEIHVSSLMRHCSPTHFLLDGFDEFESTSPVVWRTIQLGLFWYAFRVSTTRRSLRGVFLTVAMRESVLQATYGSQHVDRFDFGETILLLNWDKRSASVLFRGLLHKVRSRLSWKSSKKFSHGSPEVSWLGVSEVEGRQGVVEPILEYLLRHSRCSPRDLISIGNGLAQTLSSNPNASKADLGEVFKAVRTSSREIGDLALKATARELIQDRAIISEGEEEEEEANPAALETITALKALIQAVGSEVCEHGIVRRMVEDALEASYLRSLVDDPESVLSAMWRNGLVATRSARKRPEDWRFVWTDTPGPENRYALDAALVGFHSSMFEHARLRRSARGPVF